MEILQNIPSTEENELNGEYMMTDLIFSGQIFILLWAGVVLAVCVVSVDRKNSSLVQLIMENHNLHYRDARDKMQQVFISDSG